MTDREKLIGILKTCEEIVIYWACSYEEAADYLLANGVTFAKDTEARVFDKEEVYTNCTVQVLTNTVTGDVSVGWWRNDKPPCGEPPMEE